jgi:hypothetical protein
LSGNALSTAGIAPGIELNVDLGRFGLFATAWEVMSGSESPSVGAEGTDVAGDATRVFDTELGVGAYWTVAEGHQLLLLYDSSIHHGPERGLAAYEIGGIGLGYNVMIHDGIELINELKCDIPQGGEKLAFGVATGILVTLP